MMSSAAEAEFGPLSLNVKEARLLRTTSEELGDQQPPTPLHTDNTTVKGYSNDIIKKDVHVIWT
jgi:hypothetical protein